MNKVDYHKRPEWSYSSMKPILDSGVDYAVGIKQGLVPQSFGGAVDLGQLVHMLVLGGDDTFALCEFTDFRSKAAREWRDANLAAGKNIITLEQHSIALKMINNIKNHPHTEKYLLGKGIKHEQEMFAKTADGVDLRGKADAIRLDKESAFITDLKTTAQFDKFAKAAYWNHYDLQSATYTLIGASHLKISPSFVNAYFCVVETVAPYRVQYFHASAEFLDSGERKLRRCLDEIIDFGDNKPNFLIEEIAELGDWSI